MVIKPGLDGDGVGNALASLGRGHRDLFNDHLVVKGVKVVNKKKPMKAHELSEQLLRETILDLRKKLDESTMKLDRHLIFAEFKGLRRAAYIVFCVDERNKEFNKFIDEQFDYFNHNQFLPRQ